MVNVIQIAEPFIASELDFHRQKVAEEFAAAELRRRRQVSRREKRQQLHRSRAQRRNSPRTA
jgi:hypothetical protein